MNIAEILKDCPKGTKLYSPVYGDVYLLRVMSTTYSIVVRPDSDNDFTVSFTSDGRLNANFNGECMLFPSKENRDWRTFNKEVTFKTGDFVYRKLKNGSEWISIHSRIKNDEIISIVNCANIFDEEYFLFAHKYSDEKLTTIDDVINKRLATNEEKTKLLEILEKEGYSWDEDKKVLKENIKHLKPFDKVLVRDSDNASWQINLFSYNTTGYYKYWTLTGGWKQCIPFEGNEHLLGTSNPA